MTAERRLAAIEASLSPTQRVVRWLAEAHEHGSFEAWGQATFAAGPDALPLDRLGREAADAVRRSRRGAARDTEDAVYRAVLDTVFRVQLVLRIIEVTDTTLRREVLILAALSAHLALTLETAPERRPGAIPLAAQRDLLFARVAELHALEAVRTIVEDRYLDGQTALFPDAVENWADQVRGSEEMAVRALRLAELDGVPALDEAHLGEASDEQVGRCVDDLVEAARIKALDELGDGRAAVSRAIRWLGPRLRAEADGSTL